MLPPSKQARLSINGESPKNPLGVSVLVASVLDYLPDKYYTYFAPVNTIFNEAWKTSRKETQTLTVVDGMSETQLVEAFESGLATVNEYDLLRKIVRSGRIDLLVKTIQIRDHIVVLPIDLISESAMIGHLEMTDFIYSSNGEFNGQYVQERLQKHFHLATTSGNFQLVKWFLTEGCMVTPYEIDTACRGGHLEILQMLMDTGGVIHEFIEDSMDEAIAAGHMHIVQYLETRGFNVCSGVPTIMAIRSGNLDILKYVVSKGAKCWEETIDEVGYFGHIHLLEYMKDNPGVFRQGIDIRSGHGLLRCAVDKGQMNVLEWGVENGYILTKDLCEEAALTGDLETLKWLRERGCAFGKTASVAKERGHIVLYTWAKMNGCLE